MTDQLLLWFLFNVTIALLPFGFSVFRIKMEGREPTLEELFSKGELLIVAVAIDADALGSIISNGQEFLTWKIVSGAICMLFMLFACYGYAELSDTSFQRTPQVNQFASKASILLSTGSLLISGVCKILTIGVSS
ncbi:hypothetical protein [Scytonema millei]|uniref:Uncharacterized protein n=1 Tax=Scytonema millei VB511283 TaxID=1245923 RepID=A0A9X5I366_9CYAN|nr:hypothetical protein [Scytonema millei]NHC33526.1 hypothetical protein [Scytonema millei VB511283]